MPQEQVILEKKTALMIESFTHANAQLSLQYWTHPRTCELIR